MGKGRTNETPLPADGRVSEHNRVEARDVEADGDGGHAEDDGPEQELVVPEIFENVRVGVPITQARVSIEIT